MDYNKTFLVLFLLLLIPFTFALEVGLDGSDSSDGVGVNFVYTTPTNYSSIPVVNVSDWWDNLDTPADINTADLTDDNTYVEIGGDTMTGDLNITNIADHTRLTLNAVDALNAVALIFSKDNVGQWSIQNPYASDNLSFYSYDLGAYAFTLEDATGIAYFINDVNVGGDLVMDDNTIHLTDGGEYIEGLAAGSSIEMASGGEIFFSFNENDIAGDFLIKNFGAEVFSINGDTGKVSIANNLEVAGTTNLSGNTIVEGDLNVSGLIYGDGSHLSNTNLFKDLVLDLPFQEGSQLRDFSGQGNDGVATGTTWNATESVDGFGAYEFDGDGDYINIADVSFPASNFSFSLWFKQNINAVDGGLSQVFLSPSGWTLYQHVANNLIYLAGSSRYMNWVPSVGGWHHLICVVHDGGNSTVDYDADCYGDGVLKTLHQAGYLNPSTYMRVGTSTTPINGSIDEVLIFNRSLSAEQAKSIYESGLRGREDTYSGYIENLNITEELSIGQKITFAFGEFIDNLVDGWIRINGNLNVTGNFTGNQIYGEMWYHNHTATALTFAVDGLFYNLTMDNSDVNGFTFNDTEESLTPLVAGKYKVGWMASGDGENNEEYYTTILVNGVDHDRCEAHKKMTAGGDIVTMTGNCFVDLTTSDYVQLGTANIGGTSSGNYYSANINLIRIGD